MRYLRLCLILCLVFLGACSKKDPILPGTRTAIFAGNEIVVTNTTVPSPSDTEFVMDAGKCPYTQDSNNVIWHGDKKIFSGFPTANFVKTTQIPVCDGGFVYAGLTTGELIKINPRNRYIEWVADIYRASNLTGGASVLDIIAPIVIDKSELYVGGLGDLFCKIQKSTGSRYGASTQELRINLS